jgi:hypothetical protein
MKRSGTMDARSHPPPKTGGMTGRITNCYGRAASPGLSARWTHAVSVDHPRQSVMSARTMFLSSRRVDRRPGVRGRPVSLTIVTLTMVLTVQFLNTFGESVITPSAVGGRFTF